MNKRWYELLGTTALVVSLTLVGCGTKDDDDQGSEDKSDATVVDAAPDTAQDAGTVKKDAGPTVKKDAGPAPKVACGEALSCLVQCSSTTGACADKCKTDLGDGVEAKLKAFEDCRSKECAGADSTTKEVNCIVDKCYAVMDACLTFGGGKATCTDTASCLGACTFGDLACNVACLSIGTAAATPKAQSYKTCFDAKCADKEAAQMPGCATESCATEVEACVGATKMDCSTLSACVAKCPSNNKTQPNYCDAYCRSFSQAESLAVWSKYETCKEQCVLVINPVGCVIDKCSKEQETCYTEVGKSNCQAVYDCVLKDCDGVGGDPACIDKCRLQGNASAQDAFLHWEGCVLLMLQREEAQTVGCSFPYDQATCLNYISNHFCGNKAAHCFTSN